MKRIRLQVALLPWAESRSQSSSAPLKPWLQVCTQEMTLQDLADQIVKKFSSIYAGLGTLNIKHLESDWGEILDLTDTVGDVFDDRAPSGESRTSIVRVARYPPDSSGLRPPVRFGSLMPESSARPNKRPLAHSSSVETQNIALSPLPTIEDSGSQQPSVTLEGANKRQKRHTSRRMSGVDESNQGETRAFSQTSRAYVPVQVHGSQDLPQRKHPNPSGTPTSLPHDQLALHYHDHDVPDSSNRRRARAIGLDRESTKSESPELRVSVHDTPPHNSSNQHAIQSNAQTAEAQRRSLLEHDTDSSLQSIGSQMPAPSRSKLSQNRRRRRLHGPQAASEDRLSHQSGRLQRMGGDVLDHIESDTPRFGGNEHVPAAQGLRFSRTPEESSHRTSSGGIPGGREAKAEKERLAKKKAATEAEAARLAEEQAEIDSKAREGRAAEQDSQHAEERTRAEKMRAKEQGQRAAEEFLAKKRAESERASTAPISRSATPGTWKHPLRCKVQKVRLREEEAKKRIREERSPQQDEKKPIQSKLNVADEIMKNKAIDNLVSEVEERVEVALSSEDEEEASSVSTQEKSKSKNSARQRPKTTSSMSGPRLESEDSVNSTSDSHLSSVEEAASPTVKPKIASQSLVVSQDNVSTNDSSMMPSQRPMSPPSTNSTDHDDAANAQLQSEYRASISPLRSRKTILVNGVKPEQFRYPKLSEMMRVDKDIPTRSSLPKSSAVGGPPEESFDDEDEDSNSDGDQSSNSDEEGLGLSMVKGLRKLATMGRKNSTKIQAG